MAEVSWPIPMKAIGAQNLLTMPGGVTNSGYLHKRGGKQLQLFKWPLRYVIIHKGCVYYFKTSTSAASQGAFSLNGYNRVMRAAEETTSNNVFPFKMVHISKKHRTWYFSAASEEERKKWMLSLRKEIDRYHEKKETFTDLSDSASDSDSFYGSVERPVDIKYTHNPADESWHDDDDDDEEDYIQPDMMDAPSYPIPPIPEVQKTERLSGILKPPPPPPPTRPKNNDSGRPPVPPFPPNNDLIHRTTDKDENDPKKDFMRFPSKKPPLLPPQPVVPRRELMSSQLKKSQTEEPAYRKKPPYVPGNNFKFQDELSNRISNAPPSVLEKSFIPPNHVMAPVPPSKPKMLADKKNTMNDFAPPVPRKPRESSSSVSSPEEPSPSVLKSLPNKPPTISKPPPLPKIKKPEWDKPGFSPILRTPPDGESIRDIPKESRKDDSDDDYEKVPLPISVFVNTCDSVDVERMFKATSARGSPLNGLFCIRNSAKAGKVLVVWDKLESKVRNYRIFEKDSCLYLESENLFPDIASLVEHYYGNPLPSHDSLVLQYAYGSPNNPR